MFNGENSSISSSFRRPVRGGEEAQQLDQLSVTLDSVSLSNMDDRWYWDLNGDGVFLVKDVRSLLDEVFLLNIGARLVGSNLEDSSHCIFFIWVSQLRRCSENLLVDGGFWMFNLMNHMMVGSLGSNLYDLDLRRKMCWKASFTFLGGAFAGGGDGRNESGLKFGVALMRKMIKDFQDLSIVCSIFVFYGRENCHDGGWYWKISSEYGYEYEKR
ncbi:hypothetical protein Tco_1346927 [Tanacetum coccineum]